MLLAGHAVVVRSDLYESLMRTTVILAVAWSCLLALWRCGQNQDIGKEDSTGFIWAADML
jgi:hypothetical protein